MRISTREEICIATMATALRGQVAEGMIAQAEADAQLAAYGSAWSARRSRRG